MKRPRGRPKGYRLSQVSKDKISKSKQGQTHTPETKEKIAASLITYFQEYGIGGGDLMIEGKRILADLKFNVIDGNWNETDIAVTGHRLYGVSTADFCPFYEKGEYDTHMEVPGSICDRRRKKSPEVVHLMHRHQPLITRRLWCYNENPNKVRKLHAYLTQLTNMHRANFGKKKIAARELRFPIHSFVTISPNHQRCLWRITTKTRDANKQPVKFPILAKINNEDAGLYNYKEVVSIAGDMVFDECNMKRREVSSLACSLSAMTRDQW